MKINKEIKDIQDFFVNNYIYPIQTKSNLYLLRNLRVINKVKSLISKKNIRILDLGCGYGYNTYLVNSLIKKSNILGIDYNSKKKTWRTINKKIGYIRFIEGDARKIPFKNDYFDLVIMWGVLEHVGERKLNKINKFEDKLKKITQEGRCLSEVYRVLKPKGIFSINYLPNKYTYIEFFTKYFKNLHTHFRKFTKKEISFQLKDNNFRIISIKRVHFIPSLYYHFGNKVGNFFDKNFLFFDFIDRSFIKTPLNFFAQDFEIICKKIKSQRKKLK